ELTVAGPTFVITHFSVELATRDQVLIVKKLIWVKAMSKGLQLSSGTVKEVIQRIQRTIQSTIQNSLQRSRAIARQLMQPQRARAVILSIMLLAGMVCTVALSHPQAAYATNYDRKNLRQQSFAGEDLTDNDYTRADLTEADLSNTNLRGVRLFTTHLDRANLEGADLTGATLDGATLIRANLKNAVLEGAYVISADFRGTDIEGADFTDVLFDPRVNDMLCEIASGTNPVTGRDTRETLYCP
ncbi:MAG: pentapeptide repeat-containing protein, partial [Cyanobacteria bacterium J06553_1]